ncbi:class I SAM-dependent methyltransferase [Candidatus Aerophobetes bacterium]|nr:class I SAM-dependent methyltransferase [Candidatus Aerophobetes bacterium]
MNTERIHKEIAKRLGKVESVLDIGCGNGATIRFLAEYVAHEAIGIDIAGASFSEEWVSQDGNFRRAECIREDAYSIKSFSHNRFDAVVTVHAFHELSHPISALHEVKRVLKPSGKILIADFAKGHEGEKIWGETYYSPKQVEAMLKKCDFTQIDVKRVSGENFLFALAKKEKEKNE